MMNSGRSLSTNRLGHVPPQKSRIFYSSTRKNPGNCRRAVSLPRLSSRSASPSPKRQIPSRPSLQLHNPSIPSFQLRTPSSQSADNQNPFSPTSERRNPSSMKSLATSFDSSGMESVNEPQLLLMALPPQPLLHILSPPPHALPPIPLNWLDGCARTTRDQQDKARLDLQKSFHVKKQERHPKSLTVSSPPKLSLPPAPPYRPLPPPPLYESQHRKTSSSHQSTNYGCSDEDSPSSSKTSFLNNSTDDQVTVSRRISATRHFLRSYINVPLSAIVLAQTDRLGDSAQLLMKLRTGARRVAEMVTVGAALAGDANSISELAKGGIDLSYLPEAAGIALQIAADNGDMDVILELLRAGADPCSGNKFGDTILHRASRAGQNECVALLINWGADLEARNWFGHTPLHDAARWGHTLVVKQLLEAGANFDSVNCLGETPRQLSKLWSPSPSDI